MWQRFSERSRRVVLRAQEEAGRHRHAVVDTEHLLLGILADEDCPGAAALRHAGLDAQQIREALALGTLPTSQRSEPKLTPPARRALELAAEEAERMRLHHIDTEHLLLALLLEKCGRAYEVLSSQGLELEHVRYFLKSRLDGEADFHEDVAPTKLASPQYATLRVRSKLETDLKTKFDFEADSELFGTLIYVLRRRKPRAQQQAKANSFRPC
jgi:ATP-dependent Clp protease ATP-binding subunit ClpC